MERCSEDVMCAWGERVFWRALTGGRGARSDKIVWGAQSARRVFLACLMDTINGALSRVVLRYRELNFKCIEILCGVVTHEVSSTTCARDTQDLDVYAILYPLNPVQWNITFEVSRYTIFE